MITTNLAEGKIKTKLIIVAVGIAAILLTGIGSHTAFAIKASNKSSSQDGYNAGFAAGRKDKINGNEFDNKPPKGHSDAYDEGYKRGYDDGWCSKEHISSNSAAAAAASSSAAVGDGSHGHHHHKDSSAASSSSSAAAADDASAAAAASSSAAVGGGRSAAAASSSASASS